MDIDAVSGDSVGNFWIGNQHRDPLHRVQIIRPVIECANARPDMHNSALDSSTVFSADRNRFIADVATTDLESQTHRSTLHVELVAVEGSSSGLPRCSNGKKWALVRNEPNIKIQRTHSEEQAERIDFGILKHLLKIAI